MVIDPVAGVTDVRVMEKGGEGYFAYHAVEALRRWKFRPGTPRLVRVWFGTGRAMSEKWTAPQRQSLPMDRVLAPFIGKGTLVQGDLPDYPSKPAWTNKHGTGVLNCTSIEPGGLRR